jgi:TPR repeat protein
MSAARAPRLALAVLALAAACLLPGCGDDDGARPPGEPPVSPDQRAWQRAQRMVREASLCESGRGASGPGADRARHCGTACDLGHSNSCDVAGELREAAGAPAEALALYSRSCDGGSGLGCEAAGRARRAGIGGPRDAAAADRLDRRARFYLRVHCEQRHARSCLVLGRLYTTTRGGPADRGTSATFLGRACSLGVAEACAERAS